MARTMDFPLREGRNRQGENICHAYQTKNYHPGYIKSIYTEKQGAIWEKNHLQRKYR